jgi:hypothetical protein
VILSLLMTAAAEEPTFTPEVQVRPRFEADTGEDGAAGGERFFVIQRSRLGGRATMGAVTVRAVLQDSRVWGSEADPGKVTAEDLDLRIASAKLTLGDGAALTIGRQEIRWHEQRLIAIANWQPVGRVFDAALLDIEQGVFHLQYFGAITAEGDADAYEEEGLSTGGIAGLAGESALLDAVYLYDADDNQGRARHTAGVYATIEQGIFAARVEGYLQRGSIDDATISTAMLAVNASVAPAVAGKPKITLWYDYLSGDDDLTDDQDTAFVMVYGAKHKFMGIADIVYYQLGGPTDGQGLHNPALKLKLAPADGLILHLDAHTFLAATDTAAIGNEVDVKAVYALTDGVKLSAGSGVFLGAGSRPADLFSWLTLDARFN